MSLDINPQFDHSHVRGRQRELDPEGELERILEADPDPVNAGFRYLIWGHKIKATPARIDVLRALSTEANPVSAAVLHQKSGNAYDQTTIYRALEVLAKAGIVDKISLTGDRALYEISYGRAHHHHAVCTYCGDIEDVKGCEERNLNDSARAGLKRFKRLESHSLEFFGVCRKCDKRS